MFTLHAPRIVSGFGAVDALPAELAALGVTRPLIVTDRNLIACGVAGRVSAALKGGAHAVFDAVPENPTSAGVDAAAQAYHDAGCDGVVAVGGGSVIDSAKMVAILATHGGRCDDYIGFSEKVGPRVAPLLVLPTTAGTGSEASTAASIHPTPEARALSVNSRHALPRVALCDPELTLTLPRGLTAATGMDALSHGVESYLAAGDHPILDALSLEAVRLLARALPAAVRDGADREARAQVMTAALIGGMAIAKGIGPAHAIAIVCGDQGVNHGVLSNLGVLAWLDLAAQKAPDRVAALAAAMGLPAGGDLRAAVLRMTQDLGLPTTLSAAGYVMRDVEEAARACHASRFNAASRHHPSVADYRAMLESIA